MYGFSRRNRVGMRPEEERGVIVVAPVHTQSRSETCLRGPVVCWKALCVPAAGEAQCRLVLLSRIRCFSG